MQRIIHLLFLFFTASAGFTQTIKRIDGSKITASQLNHKIEWLMKEANVSGLAISVFNNNKPVFTKTYGWANVPQQQPLSPQSVMYGASFAKTVFACIAMQLIEEKLIELDKPLQDYLTKPLPEYEIKGFRKGYQDLKNDDRYRKITARMCLTHTTGFPNWRWFEPDKKMKIKFEPGSRYSYSGEGLYLLQFVIEQLTGKDYETIAQERVFQPLGMYQTSQLWQPRFENSVCYGHSAEGKLYPLMKWNEAGGGGTMSTTPVDFTKFFTALLQRKIISKAAFQQMTTPQVRIRSRQQFGPQALVDSTDNDAIELSYGLGVGVFKTPFGPAFFKEGHYDGWGHYSIGYPDRKIGIFIMTNNDNGERIFKELLDFAIKDVYTPWQWENYIPFNLKL